jgi:hypothetical protein
MHTFIPTEEVICWTVKNKGYIVHEILYPYYYLYFIQIVISNFESLTLKMAN